MSEETKKDSELKSPERRLFAQPRGEYILVDGNKTVNFSFPANSSLEDNLASLSFIRSEILKAIDTQAAAEKEKKIDPEVKTEPEIVEDTIESK